MKVGQRAKAVGKPAPALPVMLKQLPEGDGGISDVHRFWEQTGSFYLKGQGWTNLVDPFMAVGDPRRDRRVSRHDGHSFRIPEWHAKLHCLRRMFHGMSDSAIPAGLDHHRCAQHCHPQDRGGAGARTRFLRKSAASSTRNYATRWTGWADVRAAAGQRDNEALPKTRRRADERAVWKPNLTCCASIGGFKFATQALLEPEREEGKRLGGLFSITVNPTPAKAAACALRCAPTMR